MTATIPPITPAAAHRAPTEPEVASDGAFAGRLARAADATSRESDERDRDGTATATPATVPVAIAPPVPVAPTPVESITTEVAAPEAAGNAAALDGVANPAADAADLLAAGATTAAGETTTATPDAAVPVAPLPDSPDASQQVEADQHRARGPQDAHGAGREHRDGTESVAGAATRGERGRGPAPTTPNAGAARPNPADPADPGPADPGASARLTRRAGPDHAAVTPATPAVPGSANADGPATTPAIPASPARDDGELTAPIAVAPPATRVSTAARPDAVAAPGAVRPAAPPAAIDQVVAVLTPMQTRPDGSYELELELRPAELGRVEIRLEMRNGVLHAHLRAEQPATVAALRDSLAQLREHLVGAGVSAGQLTVDAGGAGWTRGRHAAENSLHDAARRAPNESNTSNNPIAAAARAAADHPSVEPSRRGGHHLDLHV